MDLAAESVFYARQNKSALGEWTSACKQVPLLGMSLPRVHCQLSWPVTNSGYLLTVLWTLWVECGCCVLVEWWEITAGEGAVEPAVLSGELWTLAAEYRPDQRWTWSGDDQSIDQYSFNDKTQTNVCVRYNQVNITSQLRRQNICV